MIKIYDIFLIILMIATLFSLDFANLNTANIVTLTLMTIAFIVMVANWIISYKKRDNN